MFDLKTCLEEYKIIIIKYENDWKQRKIQRLHDNYENSFLFYSLTQNVQSS